jgi:hypothetical protein
VVRRLENWMQTPLALGGDSVALCLILLMVAPAAVLSTRITYNVTNESRLVALLYYWLAKPCSIHSQSATWLTILLVNE